MIFFEKKVQKPKPRYKHFKRGKMMYSISLKRDNMQYKTQHIIMESLTSNVCAFGDSVLKGIVFDKKTEKYQQIENSFANLSCSTFGIPITNFGKFGSTIETVEKSFMRYYDRLNDFQYIVFECGGNDCDHNWKEIAENPGGLHYPRCTIPEFTEKYNYLINKVKEMGKVPILLSLPPIDAERYLNTLSKSLNKENIMDWMDGCVQYITNWHERYNLEVFKIARDNSVDIIDITTVFLDMKDYRTYLCDDGIHPNEKGHSLIAETINAYVEKRFGLVSQM